MKIIKKYFYQIQNSKNERRFEISFLFNFKFLFFINIKENEYLLISKKKSSQRIWTIVGFGLALLVVITAVVVSLMWSAKDNSNSSSSSFSSTNPSISSFSSTNPSISCPASNFPLGYHSFYDYDTIAKKETNQQPILIQNGLIWTGTGDFFFFYR